MRIGNGGWPVGERETGQKLLLGVLPLREKLTQGLLLGVHSSFTTLLCPLKKGNQ